ncbi:MAG: hypothetical protein ACOCQD_01180 [archaeon]
MKFYNYLINERMESSDEKIEEIFKIMSRDCKNFLKEYKKKRSPGLLYSGRRKDEDYFIGKVRKNRDPKDTPQQIHDIADNYFKEYYGIKLRSNSLFCTMSRREAMAHGDNIYIVFPMGDYKIFYNPNVRDLFTEIAKFLTPMNEIKSEKSLEELKKHLDDVIQGYLQGLPAMETEVEIMLYGKKYLAIDETF